MKIKEQSCGFLIKCRDKYLICHPTGHKRWSIPKGKIEFGETKLDTAIRELKEETGIDLYEKNLIDKCEMTYLCTYSVPNRNKDVTVFLLVCDDTRLEHFQLKCESTFTKHGKEVQEMDEFKWVSADQLPLLLMSSQIKITNYIKEK